MTISGRSERGRKKYLEEKAAKYNLKPVALGLFGGVYNCNKAPWCAKKAKEMEENIIQILIFSSSL
jgi:hypothetical protein